MMKRVIMMGCVLVQMIVSIAVAGEMPARVNPNINHQTLEGMPLPGRVSAIGTLKGFIQTSEGTPLADGDVFFFNDATGPPPAPEKYWRVPDEIALIDDRGGFSVELLPGRYYIGAILKKVDKAMIGPPSDGDIFYVSNEKYEVLPASLNNVDVIRGAKPFSMNILTKGESITAIEGSVFDKSGKPVENVMVFAHKQPAMNGRPLFVSERTDKHGAFHLRVAGARTYYLRVRNIYGGGKPATGAFMGVYGGDNPKGVTVKDGEVIKGINLTGEKLLRSAPRPK